MKKYLPAIMIPVLLFTLILSFSAFASSDTNCPTIDNDCIVFNKDTSTMSVTVDLENVFVDKSAQIVMATYDGNDHLTSIATKAIYQEDRSAVLNVPDLAGNKTIKLITLQSLSSLKPICPCAEYNISDFKSGKSLTIYSDSIYRYDETKKTIEYFPYDTGIETKKIMLDSNAEMYLNNSTNMVGKSDWGSIFEDYDIELVFTENTGDSKYDIIRATRYNYGIVSSAEPDTDRIEIDGDTFRLDFDDDFVTIVFEDAEGNALTLEDFKKGDVVAYFTDNGRRTDFEYIKIINLSDNTVTGTVDETSSKNGKWYVTINGKQYEDQYGLNIDDEGTFYIGITGSIIDFCENHANKNYAVILETGYAAGTFNKGDLEVKLLTSKYGIVTYQFTDAANYNFEYYMKSNFGHAEADFYDTKGNPYSFITYKVNAKNEIKSFEHAIVDDVKGEYNAKTQKIDGGRIALAEDAIVFNLTSSNPDKTYATDLSFLIDKGTYDCYVFFDNNKNAFAVAITAAGVNFNPKDGFAIVTGVCRSKDSDGQDVYKVSYLKNEEEGIAIFNDDSEDCGYYVAADELQIGDVFVFNALSNGLVRNYAVLGQMYRDTIELNRNIEEGVLFDNRTEFVYGYIKSINMYPNIINIELDNGCEYTVSKNDTNKYTFISKGGRIAIENGDFRAGDVDEEYDNEVSMVLIKIYDDEVTDVYSFGNRVPKY